MMAEHGLTGHPIPVQNMKTLVRIFYAYYLLGVDEVNMNISL